MLFPEKSPINYSSLKVGTTDYRELDLTPRNALTYVCGYLLKKCLDKHTCEICLSFCKSQNHLDESFLFIHLKAYQTEQPTNFGNLNVSPESSFNYINELDNIFITNFPTLAIENNVGMKLKNLINNVPFTHPCSNFKLDFLNNLYLRLRIFHAVKKINKDLLSAPRKHRKLDILSHL